MRKAKIIYLLLSATLLLSCSNSGQQLGCTLDQLNLYGNVRRVETIVQTSIPITEMYANQINPAKDIITNDGNVLMEFDENGNICKYIGYGVDGDTLFCTNEFNRDASCQNNACIVGNLNSIQYDDVEIDNLNGNDKVYYYKSNGDTIMTQKVNNDANGDITIIKRYDDLSIKFNDSIIIEKADTSRIEYLEYDDKNNWTEAYITYKGVLKKHNYAYTIKRQITYDGQTENKPLIEELKDCLVEESTSTPSKMVKVNIGSYASIEIPLFMKEVNNEKQSALNASSQSLYQKSYEYENDSAYASIIISATRSNDIVDLSDISPYNKDVDEILKEQYSKILEAGGIHILKWYSYEVCTLDGNPTLLYSYYRYGIGSPIPVYVENYTIYAPDGLTFSLCYSFQSNKQGMFAVPFFLSANKFRLK